MKKLCKDCDHHDPGSLLARLLGFATPRCKFSQAVNEDLVNGGITYTPCSTMRIMSDQCSPLGDFFEPKARCIVSVEK